MIRSPRAWAVLALLLAIASPTRAQQRPSEEELFGSAPDGGTPERPRDTGPPPERATETPASLLERETAKGQQRSRDERELSAPATPNLFATEPTRDNPLVIGGQIYLRSIVQGSEGQALGKDRFLLPALVDGYFDARPSDRVRGMVLGRLTYDPTLDASGNANLGPASAPAFGSGSTTTGSGFTLPTTSNPAVLLDQLWVNFDIARTLFITAGKQHVKWGVSRFWNPTDFLTPQRRDPLAVFDPRLGASMVKVHLPSEHGWNLYGIGLIDNAGPASTVGQLGGAIRGEIAFARSEIGAEAVFVRGRRDRFGVDASSAIGPLDAYVEAAVLKGTEVPVFRVNPNPPVPGLAGQFEQFFPNNYNVAVSGGFNTTIVLRENDNLVLGVEYFYNEVGYDSDSIYPFLIFRDFTRTSGPPSFQPFYLGRHYGAVYATFTSPRILGENGSLILSNLSNLSDRSVITRLDFLTRVLSYLYLEAYADVHYGRHGGEFRLQLDIPAQQINPTTTVGPFKIPAPLFDAGLGVRIKI